MYFGVVITVMIQQKYLVRILTLLHWFVCVIDKYILSVIENGIMKGYIGIIKGIEIFKK